MAGRSWVDGAHRPSQPKEDLERRRAKLPSPHPATENEAGSLAQDQIRRKLIRPDLEKPPAGIGQILSVVDSETHVYCSIPMNLIFQAKSLRRKFRLYSLSDFQGDRIKPFV